MGRLDRQVSEAARLLGDQIDRGAARRLEEGAALSAPGRSSAATLVLADETGAELGSPAAGSLSLLAWTEADLGLPGGTYLAGPDLGDLGDGASVPLGRVVLVRASDIDDEYGFYLDLQAALASASPEGVSARTRPSTGSVWYRVGREAKGRGLSLGDLGAALRRGLAEVEGVEGAIVLFLTGRREAFGPFEEPAREASRIVAALVKSSEEEIADCDECEYADICSERRAP